MANWQEELDHILQKKGVEPEWNKRLPQVNSVNSMPAESARLGRDEWFLVGIGAAVLGLGTFSCLGISALVMHDWERFIFGSIAFAGFTTLGCIVFSSAKRRTNNWQH